MTTLTLRVEESVPGQELVGAEYRIDLLQLDSYHLRGEALFSAVRMLRFKLAAAVAEKKQVGATVTDDARARSQREWRAKHRNADLLIASKKSEGRIIAAVYYEPEARDEAQMCAFWRQLADEMESNGV